MSEHGCSAWTCGGAGRSLCQEANVQPHSGPHVHMYSTYTVHHVLYTACLPSTVVHVHSTDSSTPAEGIEQDKPQTACWSLQTVHV